MAKQLMFDTEARNKLRDGVAKLSRAVKVTLGATGRNVILEKGFGKPVVTRDGVTVAKEVELKDPFENMGAKLVQEVASKTASVAGDGTTTATLLAESILVEGMKGLAAGANPMHVKRGIDRAVAAVVAELRAMSREVKDRREVAQVGFISSREEAIGELFADAFEKVGKEGVITIEDGRGINTELDVVEGFQIDKGYISPYFVTNPGEMTCLLEDCFVLLHEKKISNLRDFLPILEQVARLGRPLLVIAEDVEGEALAALVLNRLRGILQICAVKAPGFGDRRKELLEDMAILTGGRVVSEETGAKLENLTVEALGRAKKVIVEKEKTTIIQGGGGKEAVEARARQVKKLIQQSTSDYDRDKLKERLAKLAGGVAIVKVGGATEIDMKERKMRVDDALHATRAALAEGIVPGGGIAFIHAAQGLAKIEATGDEKLGVRIIARALETPLRQIARNAGHDGSVAVIDARMMVDEKLMKGLDARSGKWVDMWEAGIIDPTKVSRTALEKAASVASLMLTTETIVTELKEEEGAVAGSLR
jgi:chaperonin GroEL